MKKILLVAALFSSMTVLAQNVEKSSNDVIKERKEMAKMSAKALDAKVTKLAKKEAKRLKKEGWMPGPGTLPIEKQVDDLYRKRTETSGDVPKYIAGNADVTGKTYTAAKKSAMEFARQDVAEQIGAEVAELIDTKVGNQQLSTTDAESITQYVNASKSLIQQNIGRLLVIEEIYQDVNDGIRLRLGVMYDIKQAKSAIMKALENATEETKKQLDEITQDWGK